MQPKNRMRENRTSGTVRGAPGNRRSYREIFLSIMKKKLIEIESFVREIIPEFIVMKAEIQIEKPRLSNIRTFDALFELGQNKYLSDKIKVDEDLKEPFISLLNKRNMDYSCFLSYCGGCINGKYGSDISRDVFLKMIEEVAKVGKEIFL